MGAVIDYKRLTLLLLLISISIVTGGSMKGGRVDHLKTSSTHIIAKSDYLKYFNAIQLAQVTQLVQTSFQVKNYNSYIEMSDALLFLRNPNITAGLRFLVKSGVVDHALYTKLMAI
jgi:hypothetical protein